ncbi:MAG: ABC transporter permease [Limnochordia bacterium]|jgi:peptide/nickel transport system permease protein
MSSLRRYFKQLIGYPTAILGLLLIFILIGVAAYTIVTIPYERAIDLWRGHEESWVENPRNARPKWVNYFREGQLPETLVMSTQDPEATKLEQDLDGIRLVTSTLSFDYHYDDFPSEIILFFTSSAEEQRPFVVTTWILPDGRRLETEAQALASEQRVYLSLDNRVRRALGQTPAETGLFSDQDGELLKGTYQLEIQGYLFEDSSDFDAKLVVYGKVHGWAGTDHMRRDLMVALMWGAPLALAFGLLAALGSTIATFIISAIGAWYGGWVDALIQRITEVNLILPVMPVLIMVGTLYSRSIWTMLGMVILLSIFGGGIKTYRSVFLQIKTAPYMDAARAYGASNMRLIFRYVIPRMIPVLIPSFITSIPSFVFLEASLALLGLGDPTLPTWGKLLQDAFSNGAIFKGHYYWVLEPAVLLMITGLSFAMVGFALDRIFNPRLRGL